MDDNDLTYDVDEINAQIASIVAGKTVKNVVFSTDELTSWHRIEFTDGTDIEFGVFDDINTTYGVVVTYGVTGDRNRRAWIAKHGGNIWL